MNIFRCCSRGVGWIIRHQASPHVSQMTFTVRRVLSCPDVSKQLFGALSLGMDEAPCDLHPAFSCDDFPSRHLQWLTIEDAGLTERV